MSINIGSGSRSIQPVSGVVSVDNFPAIQLVNIATLPLPISAAALPLPANAAQETGGNLATLAGTVAAGSIKTHESRVFKTYSVVGAVGATAVLTVPAGKRWTVIGVFCKLVTNATVINRAIGIVFNGGPSAYFVLNSPIAHPASTEHWYNFASGIPTDTAFGVAISSSVSAVQGCLSAGQTIEVSAANLQAGDQITLVNAGVIEEDL